MIYKSVFKRKTLSKTHFTNDKNNNTFQELIPKVTPYKQIYEGWPSTDDTGNKQEGFSLGGE